MTARERQPIDEEMEELLADPATPFWAAAIIREAAQHDPVDANKVLARLAAWTSRRARRSCEARSE